MSKPTSDMVVPDFALMLATSILRVKRYGAVPFTDLLAVVVGYIVDEGKDPLDALAERVVYRIEEPQIPKYVCLISWLSLFGIPSPRPGAIRRLARFLLGVTMTQEIRGLPAFLRRDLGV